MDAVRDIGRRVSKARRGDRARDEELVPLALSDDSDAMDEMTPDKDDRFETPKKSQPNGNGFTNGDMFKERIPHADHDVQTRCGYLLCRPDALQNCNNPKALLFFLCCFSMAQGFVVNGINNVNTTSVERRFQLPSSQVGMISSSYDLSAAILGIFISYMGSGRQKAKWLTMASLVMAVGSFIMATPHFMTGPYSLGQDVSLTCNKADSQETCHSDNDLQHFLYILILGQLLHGVGGTTLYTVGIGLIDDSVTADSSPMYIGILYAAATLGPALGYIIGGQLLAVYVDFDTISSSEIHLTPEDTRWVGAWWVGFIVASGLFVIAAIPISMYGQELPSAKRVRETRVSEMHGDDGSIPIALSSKTRKLRDLKNLPSEIIQLLKISPFVFMTLAGATEGLLTSGFATFMPKFMQNQFGLTASWASMLTGFVAVPGAAGGQFFGGYICKRFRLRVKGCLRLAIVCCTISMCISGILWARCSPSQVAGVSVPYGNSSQTSLALPELSHDCNTDCHCLTEIYEPVCDQNGVQYFSPCHAGCTKESTDGKTYESCACVPPLSGNNVSSVTVGKCTQECDMMYVFLPVIFVAIFLLFTPSPPAVSASLRVIHDSQRTLGLGLKWFIVRLLGTVPGPILFGTIIDSTCVIWREKCDEHASCWIYNNENMSRNFFILVVCFKLMSITFFFIAHQLYRPPAEKVVHYINSENDDVRTISVTSQDTALSSC